MHAKTHFFCMKILNNMNFYIFERFDRMQHIKKHFFICSFLEKKNPRGFKRSFPKHILKPKKTKQKQKLILCFFILYHFFIFYLSFFYIILLFQPGWNGRVNPIESTKKQTEEKKIEPKQIISGKNMKTWNFFNQNGLK
jgi:hypothetical protein